MHMTRTTLEIVDLWKRKMDLAGADSAFKAYKGMQLAGLDALWAATIMVELGASTPTIRFTVPAGSYNSKAFSWAYYFSPAPL